MPRPRLEPARRRLARARRAVLGRRRLLAALLLGVAVLAGLRAVAPAPAGVPVVVAATDLPAGATLTAEDVATRRLAHDAVPDGVVDRATTTGRSLAAPVRRGEPLTDARLTGPSLAAAYPGRVMVPVRLPDAGVAAMLAVGDELEVLAVGADDGDARTVAVARVAGLPRDPPDGPVAGAAGLPDGRLVLLAVPEHEAPALAAAAVRHYLTVVWAR